MCRVNIKVIEQVKYFLSNAPTNCALFNIKTSLLVSFTAINPEMEVFSVLRYTLIA